MLIRLLLDSVRLLGRPVDRPYRCDSPTCKRYMSLHAIPQHGDLVRVEHSILREEPFASPMRFVTAPADRPQVPLEIRCTWCNRIRVQDTWLEPELAPLPRQNTPHRVAYSVCVTCRDAVRGAGPFSEISLPGRARG